MTSIQPALDQPLYGATLTQAVGRFFRKYATFSGRASRSEFWWVYLFIAVVSFIGGIGMGLLGNATRSASTPSNEPGPGALIFGVPLILFFLAIIVPAIALHVRRLHDANFSGLLYLITLVPYVGSFVLLIFAILPSNPAGARFDAGAAPVGYPDASAPPYPAAPGAAPGYTPAPPVQAGPPPAASPPPPAPPVDPPTA
jgi:uncharacterized membrane protein YhaH (DUF805 family)